MSRPDTSQSSYEYNSLRWTWQCTSSNKIKNFMNVLFRGKIMRHNPMASALYKESRILLVKLYGQLEDASLSTLCQGRRMRLQVSFTGGNFKLWSSWTRFSEHRLITQYSWYISCCFASGIEGVQIPLSPCSHFTSPMYFPPWVVAVDRILILLSWLPPPPTKWWCKILNSKLPSFWITNCLDAAWT